MQRCVCLVRIHVRTTHGTRFLYIYMYIYVYKFFPFSFLPVCPSKEKEEKLDRKNDESVYKSNG